MVENLLPEPFKSKIDAERQKFKDTPFSVLVWGPGESRGKGYSKRKKIRDHLASKLGEENVIFSEDAALQEDVEQFGSLVAEYFQVKAACAVVTLDYSAIGVHTEISVYTNWLLGKSLVFVPLRYRGSEGFAGTVYDTLKVEWFNEEEFEDCHYIRRTALRFVQGLKFSVVMAPNLQKI